MIDIEALRREAEVDDRDNACVVTRRWLRQVLVELTDARHAQTLLAARQPVLDFKTIERR